MSDAYPSPVPGRVPVRRLDDVLLVAVQGDLHDGAAQQLQQDVVAAIAHSGATGVIIDIAEVDVVDSFLGRVLAEIAANAELLAAETVVSGMRPAVAITLVELGMDLPGLRTALNTERAMGLVTTNRYRPRAVGRGQERP
ncbi:STAS domain-containing protein [Streptomyces sp. TRM68416]|uniref:STAS domain-containing protein n=1 Tax=Streptomyces sp. TRM68416 TaxID=2758412 RepID=UPI00166208EF|nr:STAS domain-containing protein [Streptomyces sp. TRM68416]MBD0844710.1 STAS domain-containing protein [Streptomyces sp. TRM68416]